MYPTIADIVAYGNDPSGDRPLIMCEYSHAMGNSNGSLADYWDAITSTPGLQGGFIWEWKDHGITTELPNGNRGFAYGGQFGEPIHDGNFVADGIMSADLVPHPAIREVEWVYRPVTVELAGRSKMRITNRRSFVRARRSGRHVGADRGRRGGLVGRLAARRRAAGIGDDGSCRVRSRPRPTRT